MCGCNVVFQKLLEGWLGCKLVGFVNNVVDYMWFVDFFIGKFGFGSVVEVLYMGLLVIVEKNMNMMLQEWFNLDWVVDKGVGVVILSFCKDMGVVVWQVFFNFKYYCDNICSNVLENCVVYEIVVIFECYLMKVDCYMVVSVQVISVVDI